MPQWISQVVQQTLQCATQQADTVWRAFGCKFNRNTCFLEPKLHSWRLQRQRRGSGFPHQNSCRPRYRARWPCPAMHGPGTFQTATGKEMNMAHGLVPKSEELGHAAEALWRVCSHAREVTYRLRWKPSSVQIWLLPAWHHFSS